MRQRLVAVRAEAAALLKPMICRTPDGVGGSQSGLHGSACCCGGTGLAVSCQEEEDLGRALAALYEAANAVLALTLPDPAANAEGLAHRRGRDTERAAALAVMPRSGTQRLAVLEAVARADFGMTDFGMTDFEIAAATGLVAQTVNPRRNELVSGGWLADSGRRRFSPSRHPAIVWVLTSAGAARLGQARLEAS